MAELGIVLLTLLDQAHELAVGLDRKRLVVSAAFRLSAEFDVSRPSQRARHPSLDKSTYVDTFTSIDIKGAVMLKLFKRMKERAVEFCERCSRVCDAGCRQAALRERALMQAWRFGARI
jgi:hypothetical protein